MRVKVSYTINGYNKFVYGKLIFINDDFCKVKSDAGGVIEIARRNIDEMIELCGGSQK